MRSSQFDAQQRDRCRPGGTEGDVYCRREEKSVAYDSQIDELKREIAKGQFHAAQHIVEWIGKRFKVCFSLSGVKDLLSRSRVCPPCWTTWTSIMLNWIPR